MIRSSFCAALAVGALAAVVAEPLVAFGPHRRSLANEEAAVLAQNAVGNWRLDSLIDQARVSGMASSDVDPSTFVLHDLRFVQDDGGIQPLQVPTGTGTIEKIEGGMRLKVKGTGGAFRIPIPREESGEFTREDRVGMVALSLRSKDAGEVMLVRNLGALGIGGPGLNFGGGGGGGPGFGIAGTPIVPMPPPGAPPAGGPPGGAPPAGAPVVIGPQGGLGAMMGGVPPDFDPRSRFGSNIVKFATDGEWHTVARTRSQLSPLGGMGGMMMGGDPGPQTLEEVVLVVLPPFDQAKEGGSVDLEFVHVLDAKADYASKPAAPCSITREGVIHSGMHMNTPCEASWRLVAPPGCRFRAGLTAIDDAPFDLLLHVKSDGARKTVLSQSHASRDGITALEADLSAYAGKEIEVTIEAVESDVPTVAFLLQPMIFGKRKDEVRNVFLYFTDTTRADALSCYGNPRPTTPHIDAIANEGIRFERCFSQGAWTYVSMPASLSGLYPSVSGVKNGGERIADSVTTMAEAFRAAGYLTAAFIRNDFVGPTTNTHQGFDFFFPGSTVVPSGDSPQANAARQGLQQVVARMLGRGGGGGANDAAMLGNTNIFGSGSSRDLYAKSEPWVAVHTDVPFFIYLHAVDPHDPYEPEKEDMNRFLSDEERKQFDADEQKVTTQMTRMFMGPQGGAGPGVQGGAGAPAPAPAPADATAKAPEDAAKTPAADGAGPAAKETPPVATAPAAAAAAAQAIENQGVRGQLKLAGLDPDAHIAKARALYDAEMVFFDRHLQRMVDLFKSRGLWDEMIFSLNADHGEEFLDHNNTGHGQSVYAELDHVPWILRAPGLPKGKVITDSVMNLDIAPTLLGLCGIAAPPEFQGRNLAEVLAQGDDVPAQPIFTERWGGGIQMFGGPGGGGFDGTIEFLGQWAVIEGRWKTVVTRSAQPQLDDKGKAALGTDGKPLPPVLKVELEIFDLDHDLKDANSLIASERPRAEAAAKRLETWLVEMKKLNARYADENTASEGAADALRALGYAQ